MDIQSFILGMSAVLLIALVIGSIFAVVKVIKIGKEFREVQIWINQEFENEKKEREKEKIIVGGQLNEVYRTIDSRIDKQYEKILKEVSSNKAFLQMIGKSPTEYESSSVDNDPAKSIKRIMDKLDSK
jgi:hypothetical protein